MKKVKIISVICLTVLLIASVSNFVVAANVKDFGGNFDYNLVPKDTDRPKVLDAPMIRAWYTVAMIIQVVSVAGIILTGLRYMFASADTKADLKKGLVPLIIGMVLVFGATTIIQMVVKGYEQTASQDEKKIK